MSLNNMNKVILLACGSYNPPTNMHLRMFEIARDHLHRLGNCIVIGGIISPVHDAYGKKDLEPSSHRIRMLEMALQTSNWIKMSSWEINQESWSTTRSCLQYHQNQVNAYLNSSIIGECEVVPWMPDILRNGFVGNVQVKLLCGADLLQSFATPKLWSENDIENILSQHGIVVISRSSCNPLEFVYNSDLLTKYLRNIDFVTEWITNDISSTKIRQCLRRSESIKYLLPDPVTEYIYENGLYGAGNIKYLTPPTSNSNNSLTPSPCDVIMDSPSPTNNRCLLICDKTFVTKSPSNGNNVSSLNEHNFARTNKQYSVIKHPPGQAVKIITGATAVNRKIVKVIADGLQGMKKVCQTTDTAEPPVAMKSSKSCVNFAEAHRDSIKACKSNADLKDYKSCDENLIKFIFTKHGIQVISDVETIV